MSSSLSFDFASTSSVAGIGAVSMICGSLAATAKVWKRARGVSPSEDARSSLMISTAAAPSEICEDVPAVTVPVSENAPRNPASFSSEVSRRTPSSASKSPLHVGRARHVGVHPGLQGDDLVGETALVGGPRRPLVRPQRQGVHLLAGDLPAASDLLGTLALVDELEALFVQGPVGLARPGVGGRPDRHPAHRLHAGPDGHVHGARHDRLGGEVDRLLGRPALPIDRGAGHGLWEAGGQGRVAGDVHGLLAHGHGAPHDDVLHQARIQVVAPEEGGQGLGGQVGGVPPGEAPTPAADRGAHGVDDHGGGHEGQF